MSSEYSYFDADKLKRINSKTQFVVFGFIHDSQKLFKHVENNPYFIIPDLISYIVLGFYLSPFRFNIWTTGKKLSITKDGSICEFSRDRAAHDPDCINIGDSNGTKEGECSIRINTLPGIAAFGITTNADNILSNKWLWSYPVGQCYYIFINGAGHKSGVREAHFKSRYWKKDDIIKMQWSIDGVLRCNINGERIGKMRIEKGLKYYICLCCRMGRDFEFEILDFDP